MTIANELCDKFAKECYDAGLSNIIIILDDPDARNDRTLFAGNKHWIDGCLTYYRDKFRAATINGGVE